MTNQELAHILNDMYNDGSKKGEATTMVRLFGIKYADELTLNNEELKKLAKLANLKESYATEIYKGIKLAKYVIVKG